MHLIKDVFSICVLFVCLIVLAMVMGCSRFQVKDSTVLASKIAARHLGTYVAEHYPEEADISTYIALSVLEGIDENRSDEKFQEILVDMLADFMKVVGVKDKAIEYDLRDIAAAFKVDYGIAEIPADKIALIRQVLTAYLEGVSIITGDILIEGKKIDISIKKKLDSVVLLC